MYHSSGGFWWWGWLCFCKVRGYMGNLCILPSVLLWILQCFKKLSLSSIAQSHPTLCNPLDCSMPGLPAHHQLLEFTETHVLELVIPSNHLILCCPLLLLLSTFSSIRVFSNESALRIRRPKFWSFSFNISPSNEHPGLISFRMDWWDGGESKKI